MTEPHTTKALTWLEHRERGERLPEHELPPEPDTEDLIWQLHQSEQP